MLIAQPTQTPDPPDEDLVATLARGARAEAARAFAELYRRWAPAVLRMAARRLDGDAAADVVQAVFVGVWRNAGGFDPARGTFRAWLRRAVTNQVANELRRRRRRPFDGDAGLDDLPAAAREPDEAAWARHRHTVVRAALAALPAAQRQAVALAFFEDLSHTEVADALDLPLGTAKTRIRTGLQRLRRQLAPLATGLVVLLVAAGLGTAWLRARGRLAQDERALVLVTASDTLDLRLGAAPGMPAEAHARYRGRPGAPIAVVTLSHVPAAPRGETYVVWVRHGGRWTSLGAVAPDAAGAARLVAESPGLAELPDAVVITRESVPGAAPTGPVVVAWPSP